MPALPALALSGPTHSRPRSIGLRVLAAGIVVAWLTLGGLGLYAHGRDYSIYRGFPVPTHSASIPFGQVLTKRFNSSALHQERSYTIYVPPGYRAAVARGARFPVLYLLHSPRGKPQGYFTAGALAVRMDELIAAHRIRPYLVVLPDGRTGRASNDTEWANANQGRYESYVLDTVGAVDARWATLPDRGARVIGGLSMGAYGAANITLRHPEVFSGFQSWSGYFVQTPTDAFTGASRAALRANSPLLYVGGLKGVLRRHPVHAYLYQGRLDRNSNRAEFLRFGAALRRAGVPATVAFVPGGHNWRVWRDELPLMLRVANHWFGAGNGR